MLSRIFLWLAVTVVPVQCLPAACISFSGVIKNSEVGDFPAGTPFTGKVLYDPAGPLLYGDDDSARYSVGGAGYGIHVSIGGFDFRTDGYLHMTVVDGPFYISPSFTIYADQVLIGFNGNRWDPTDTRTITTYTPLEYYISHFSIFGTLDLLNGNIIPYLFPNKEFLRDGVPYASTVLLVLNTPDEPTVFKLMYGHLDSVVSTPEPGTAALLVIGFLFGGFGLKWRGRMMARGRTPGRSAHC